MITSPITISPQVLVDIENRETIDLSLMLDGIGHLSKKRKKVGGNQSYLLSGCSKLGAQ